MMINILNHLVTFNDKTAQLFLNPKKTAQLSFQHYKLLTYKPLNVCHPPSQFFRRN